MPPPARRSPVAEVRDEFLGLKPPPRFFGMGGNMEAWPNSYAGLTQMANQRLQESKYFGALDDLDTNQAENLYRRDSAAARRRNLPFTEAADRAIAERRAQQEQVEMRLSPFEEESKQQAYLTQAEQSAQQRAPEQKQLIEAERQARMETLQSADPVQDRLSKITKSPRAQFAYESLLRDADKRLPKLQRQQLAYDASLQIGQDESAVEAIESTLLDNPEAATLRKKYIKDVRDSSGRYLGSIVSPDADIGEVNLLVRRHEMERVRQARDREERIAKSAENAIHLKVLDSRRDHLFNILKLDPDNADAKKQLKSVEDELDRIRGATPATPAGDAGTKAPVPSRWR